MDRHRTLDSSMSSLYSGSNISNTPTRQHDNTLNYPTMSSSASPTPGGPGQAYDTTGAVHQNQGLRATTIGSVVVRCGPIQLVIALLQSVDKIYIKVVELEPKITTLGANFDEAERMQEEHDETLRNIQNLPGPMEEFVQKADKLLASKRISSNLVNAMADNLNIIWQDILNLLQDRQQILHLCTQFHDKMINCQKRMDQLEVACIDTMMPIEVSTVQEFLNKFKQLRIDMLTAVMAALKDGNELLAQLQELSQLETLDTRPEHIKRDALRAVHQVQQWLEALHDRRNALEIAWQTRKTQLEQCLALALLGRELDELEIALRQQRNDVISIFSLGECEQTANNALHNYRERKQQALMLRDRALKITRAKEKLQASGTFSGDEACARAYGVLSSCTEYLDMVDQREHWLQQSRDFFAKAEHTLGILEKLEVELSNVKVPSNTSESFAMYSKVARDVRHFTEEPLRLGYALLDEVGRTAAETVGLKRVLDEIENRKVYIESICANSNEDQQRVQRALNEFLMQYNDLLNWLMSSGQMYLKQHRYMGCNLTESKHFLLQHHELMQDLEIKGELINLLLESIKTHLEALKPQQRYDVDSKAEALHKHWIELKDRVLKRVDCVSLLIKFFEHAKNLSSQLDKLDQELAQRPNEQKLQYLKDTWASIRKSFADLKSTGQRFINWNILDTYIDEKSSVAAVEEILNGFSKRQVDVTTSIESWTTNIAEQRQVEIILEKIMSDNDETATKSTKVDTQLYPVFTSTSADAKQLQVALQEKLELVLKDIDKAQEEIQQRVELTLNIRTNDEEALKKIEQVMSNLRSLKSKLDGIKYDYKTLLESMLKFLAELILLRREIDDYFKRQQFNNYTGNAIYSGIGIGSDSGSCSGNAVYATNNNNSNNIERIITEHQRFRDACMDKFRSLITQSELLIDRVRILEPPGAREIDTDRILKLLENLRIHFDTVSGERMSNLERLEKLEQFRNDLCDIIRSLDSVSKQLQDINEQNVDSLAAAKTTSLAFEYFERTIESSLPKLLVPTRHQLRWGYAQHPIELLEKRIEKFSESSKEKLIISNPEGQQYVCEELQKLDKKWSDFKEQVRQKRNTLNQAADFFEVVEKIDAEYREISYFYNSVSNKITFLRDAVEAGNLVNDIEKYLGSREGPLLEKLNNAAKFPHDMNKVSSLYNDVTTIFQSFTKLKSDINVVQERFKAEERAREQRDKAAREQAERERIAHEEEARLRAAREQAARELAEREKALREEEARLNERRELELREQAAREEQERLLVLRNMAKQEEEARLQALRAQTERDDAAADARLQSLRDHIDHQNIVSENIRKDMQVNEIFTEIRYAVPYFVRPLKDAILREGDKFSFECEVSGNPQPTIEWFKDGISILNNPDYKTDYQAGVCRLLIEETFTADSGTFSCRAANLVGMTDTTAKLSVRENAAEVQMVPPRIIRFLESGKAKEGSSHEFICVVTGNPLPTVQWYKNDKCIDDSPDCVISYNNGEAKLRFEEVFLEDDAVFTCSASNPAGIEHCSASLVVEPLEPTELPYFKIPLSNAMARVGQKIKLEALVGGIPRPDIFWMHNNKAYYPRDSKYEYGRVTLIIPQAYPNDSGSYVLTAKNLAGEAYSACNVIVKGRLPNETSDSELASDMEPIKPAVQLPLKDVSVFEGKPVRLDCLIIGQPEPEVIWYHDERPVKESTDVQLLFQGDRCSLIIKEVYQEDSGQYKVIAINSAGEASSSCEVKITPLNLAEPATRSRSERQFVPKDTQPKFEKLLSDVLADEGENVVMEVVTSGDQPLTAKWYLTNCEIIANERYNIIAESEKGIFKLIINNVNSEDKGVYTVKVSNGIGEAKCFSHLIVKSVNVSDSQRQQQQQQVEIVERTMCPKFIELFSDKSAHLGDVVKFECIVKGKPTPKIHWYFNDQQVHGHNFLVSTSGDRQVLTIQNVSTETVGKVSCVAENEVGKATCVAFLVLHGTGLQFTSPGNSDLQTMTQEHNTESSRVTIKKQTFATTSTSQVNTFEGNMPETQVHHSSAHIDQSFKQLGSQRPEIVESHHFQEMHKTQDMSAPSIQQKSFVLVQSASNATTPSVALASPTRLRKQIAPRFTTPMTGRIVDQGTDVSMEVIYDGFPSPEIRVEKNGEPLFDNDRLKIVNKCNRVTIDLKQVAVNDAGRYAVTAINTMGESTSTADLVVKKTIFPPVFGRRLQAQVVKKGEKIIMEVEVTGLPEPTVVWMKDDKALNEAGISEYRLLSQGNSHKLIVEKGEISDSGKYMVKATNAGGEAKSIADCAILEPSPERLQEVVKTIVYEQPTTDFKTETYSKEPLSFETNQTNISTATDLHGLSESKIITEHRCTTEATMRLEHKSNYIDLPELSQWPRTPINDMEQQQQQDTTKTASTNTETTKSRTGSTQTPPIVPPKPCIVTMDTNTSHAIQKPNTASHENITTSENTSTSNEQKTTSSSFELFKNIETRATEPQPTQLKLSIPTTTTTTTVTTLNIPTASLEEDLKSLNLIPGSPPEICYIPKTESSTKSHAMSEKIRKIEEHQQTVKEAPQGGVALLPEMPPTHSYKHESMLTKQVKVEYGQSMMKSPETLLRPAQQLTRSPSPKPSAEGVAMSKLWTPTQHLTGDECSNNLSDVEHSFKSEKELIREFKPQRVPSTTNADLHAPSLVKEATKSISLENDIKLVPGSPPKICYAPKQELRRQSLVEAMEKTLEQNLLQGPTRVLPHSVPTLTPPSASPAFALKQSSYYRPPPPVMPTKINQYNSRNEYYESDYESDRYRYSGSESDDTSLRQKLNDLGKTEVDGQEIPYYQQQEQLLQPQSFYHQSTKTSGYAADTEDISKNSHSKYNQPNYVEAGPLPIYTSYTNSNGHEKREFSCEEQDYKCMSSISSNICYKTTGAGPATVKFPISKPVTFSATPARKPAAEFSDYSSEVEERFRSVSRNYESDADIKGYRVVFPPTPTPTKALGGGALTNGHKSPVVVVTPSPMQFEATPPPVTTFLRQKFEPIQKEIRHEFSTESSTSAYNQKCQKTYDQIQKSQQQEQQQQQHQQHVFKPKPVAAKFIANTQQQQQPKPSSQTKQPPLYYNAIAGTPLHTAKLATETTNSMQMKESSETCQRVVNMQQTKRMIHFDSQRDETDHQLSYSSFPPPPPPPASKTSDSHQVRVQATPTPTKFTPVQFRESDYESEVENAKIRPLWTPNGDANYKSYRHVEPPQGGRSCSLPRSYERVLSPMDFDRGPDMPKKIELDVGSLRQERAGSYSQKTQSLDKHTSMRTTNISRYNQQQQQHQQQHYKPSSTPVNSFPRDDMNLKVGSPPKYGFIADQVESQGQSMRSTFLQKSHKFIDDISQNLATTKSKYINDSSLSTFRPEFKRAPSEGDNRPQAYRDESRVSEYGTKCVDPNTGLIYFKYDFGYEFGILFPGEGHKFVETRWNKSSKQPLKSDSDRNSPYPLHVPGGGDLIIPVKHESEPLGTKSPSLYNENITQRGFHSDNETSVLRKPQQHQQPYIQRKRFSLPNPHTFDLNIDRLHISKDAPMYTSELPNDMPVNAYINRDEHPRKPPMFITPLKEIAVIAGQPARFECIVQCHPQPNVIWTYKNQILQPSIKYLLEYRNGVCRLTLPQSQMDDAGSYACTATNPLGSATTSGELSVQSHKRNLRY